MPKDRAAPFSRKHRRYWIPVTGGMLLIGVINVVIGVCSYSNPPPPQKIVLHLPSPDGDAGVPGMIGPGQIPVAVVRAFVTRFPKTVSAGALHEGNRYIVIFRPGAAHKRATFEADGTFVSVE